MRDTASFSYFTDDTSAFDTPAPRSANSSDKDLQRAEGSCRIVLGSSEKGARVMDVYQRSPIRVLFPRTAGTQAQEAVLVNTSGGIAGGDRLESSVTAMDNASIAVTTQAAEKVYRAINESAHITTTLRACDARNLRGYHRKRSSSIARVSAAAHRSKSRRGRNSSPWSGWCSAARRTERKSPPETSWTVGASGKTVGWSGPTAFAPPMRFFHIFLGRHCCRIAPPSQHCSISGLTSRSVCSSYATWHLRLSVNARRRWLVV